jgi:hypothetical protein
MSRIGVLSACGLDQGTSVLFPVDRRHEAQETRALLAQLRLGLIGWHEIGLLQPFDSPFTGSVFDS